MYEKNENRIVRVKNDLLHEQIELIADDLAVPYQWIFEIWVDFVMQFGQCPSFGFFHSHCKAVIALSRS